MREQSVDDESVDDDHAGGDYDDQEYEERDWHALVDRVGVLKGVVLEGEVLAERCDPVDDCEGYYQESDSALGSDLMGRTLAH